MSEFIEKLQKALLIAYIGDVGCELSNADCNELSKYLESTKALRSRVEELELDSNVLKVEVDDLRFQLDGSYRNIKYGKSIREELEGLINQREQAWKDIGQYKAELARLRAELDTTKQCLFQAQEAAKELSEVIDKLQATMPVILNGKDGEYVCMNCGANMQYAKWQCDGV